MLGGACDHRRGLAPVVILQSGRGRRRKISREDKGAQEKGGSRKKRGNQQIQSSEDAELHHAPVLLLQELQYKTQILGELHRDWGGKRHVCSDDPQKTGHRTTAKGTAYDGDSDPGAGLPGKTGSFQRVIGPELTPQQRVTCKSSSELVVPNPSCTH